MNKANVKAVTEMAAESGLSVDNLGVAHMIAAVLEPVVDKGSGIDSGCSGADADLWFWIGGIEYYANIRHSLKQQEKDRQVSSVS